MSCTVDKIECFKAGSKDERIIRIVNVLSLGKL